MGTEPALPSLLNAADRELLRAATRTEDEAIEALARWRSLVSLDDIESSVMLVMPRLLQLATRHRADDPDIGRMKGISRHIWTSNVVKLRVLFAAMDVLSRAGIPVLLLKGAAIFARDSSATAKRVAGDYDILIAPENLMMAREALWSADFRPKEMEWRDIEDSVLDCATPGTPLEMPGAPGDIDLHWRPLPNIYDRFLTRRLFSGAELAQLHGHEVSIPSVAHHLFLAIARCEPWDSNECVARLLEGQFLITNAGHRLEWEELGVLLRRYRLEPVAEVYFRTLRDDCRLEFPVNAEIHLKSGSFERAQAEKEWALRSIPPFMRTPFELRTLARIDTQTHRSAPGVTAPGLCETFLRQFSAGPASVSLVWKMARHRVHAASSGVPLFLEGFSYPEREGRWTDGEWSLLAIPLDEAQRRSEQVELKLHAFLGGSTSKKIYIFAGRQCLVWEPRPTDGAVRLVLRCAPVKRLGADALILFWIPKATSPRQALLGKDMRRLGVFVHRQPAH